MADNVPITPGAGATIATDDVGGAQFQRFKLDVGADGASVPVVGALPVSATALPLPTGAATATGQAAIVAAIGAIPAGPGTVAVSNFPATQPVSAAALPLPAGAATEATLAALAASVAVVDAVAGATPAGQLALGIRKDSDLSPTSADGDFHPFVFNAVGRLKASVLPADTAVTTGNIAAVSATVALDVRRQGNAALVLAGTFAGLNLAFEASLDSTNGTDGTWFGIQGCRTNANIIESTSGVLGAAPAYAWEFGVSAYAFIRARASAWTSGTGALTWKAGALATEPAAASQVTATQPVSGTVTLGAGTAAIGTTIAPPATWTSRSGSIATGGTAQQIAAANASRRGFFIQNNSTGDLWFSALTTAVQSQPSVKIPAGALYETPSAGCPTGAISIIGATTAQAFTAMEF